jgi:putative addiction module component (TIGR02574 family)
MTTISTRAEELLVAALELPEEERAEIADRLLDSLPDKEWLWEDADPKWRAAWEAEIRRRIDDVRSGKVQLVDGEEVFRKLREKYSS